MPDFCSAYGCSNERCKETRARGITFHRFPKDSSLRRQWELAVRRKGFVPTKRSVLCSEHFKAEDFDRTGQIVRLREGVKPSVFNFPSYLQKKVRSRKTKTSQKAEESLPVDLPQHSCKAEPLSNVDHNYALPASPTLLKARLNEALARVESLEREKRNSMLRERRVKKNVRALLKDLREKNIINEELKDRLEYYSDLRLDLLAMKGHEYTREQREFALTLHLHGPKAYNFLRESQHLPLPHPHTLQRWLTSVDAKPGLNKTTVDMLGRRCEKDQTKDHHTETSEWQHKEQTVQNSSLLGVLGQ
ncbi:THAP domain-containing protein 6-like [Acanthochromis polyacanthus]|uniref:THAP domain-containing protein 6-like n=1 Tax=Acanthochromis polyacanthus TaxID=80966 RepID=UPI00223433E0|nr:THAP domain-containing protein 6-like [Acanthochromis polyacanthus]